VAHRSPLRFGETLDVTIEKGVYRGLGLARHEGQIVFVARGLPGERLRVRVTGLEKGYVRAVAVETLEAAGEARRSPCDFFPSCGGCAYQHLEYAAQLGLKEAVLRESLARGGIPWEAAIRIQSSPEQGWRTRASFHVDARHGALHLGLHEEASHRIVDLTGRCLQISEAMNGTLRHVREVLTSRPALSRGLHALHLAESPDGSALVATFEGALPAGEAASLAAAVSDAAWVTGVATSVGPQEQRSFVVLRGSPYLFADVDGVRLRSHARSFFQSNRFLVGALAREVGRLVPSGGALLDLFGGVGLFGLTAGRAAERVTIVEESPTAEADAEENTLSAGLGNVRVFRGDVAEILRTLRPESGERMVVDPPRTGLGAPLVSALAARNPEVVVYVSCDPTTLARDLRAFAALGYQADSLLAFDLFPDTFHVETVVRLRRAPRH
jgi:23S rRNA (uracil1939-C5)-methyltransferase